MKELHPATARRLQREFLARIDEALEAQNNAAQTSFAAVQQYNYGSSSSYMSQDVFASQFPAHPHTYPPSLQRSAFSSPSFSPLNIQDRETPPVSGDGSASGSSGSGSSNSIHNFVDAVHTSASLS